VDVNIIEIQKQNIKFSHLGPVLKDLTTKGP